MADPPRAWGMAGFEVYGDLCQVGGVVLRLTGPESRRGIVSCSLRDFRGGSLDGLPTVPSDTPPPRPVPPHPNGVVSIDHLVAFTPELSRTVAALEEGGLELRRIREQPTPAGAGHQAFFRLDDVILEVIEAPESSHMRGGGHRPARFWGLAFLVRDLDDTVGFLGDLVGEPRDAVQPGRRIATLRPTAGLGPAIAFMSPPAGSG